MILAWIRFALTALLLIVALIGFTGAVIGANRFGYLLNRMHAAGIGDTLGIFFVLLAMMITASSAFDVLKLALIVMFMWFTSPASSHFLGQVEYYTRAHLYRHTDRALEELRESEE